MKHIVEEVQLKNGTRGLLIDVPGATVMNFNFQFRAGNRYVKSEKIYETAHIMEHMAFGANAEYPSAHAFSADFEKNGAYHNASTSSISMTYLADCADFEWDRILRLQQLSITKPRFLEDEFVAESGNVHEELTGYLNNHNRVLWQKMAMAIGEPLMADADRIKKISNITLRNINEHYKRTHTLDNMRFVISGKIKSRRNAIIDMLESWELSRGERFAVPKEELAAAEPIVVRRKDVPNLIFGWGTYINERISDEAVDAMGALNHILTGSLHSRIFGTARQRGLVYGMWSDAIAQDYQSEWAFGGQVSLSKAEKLFDIIVGETRRVLDGELHGPELEAAKQYALGKHQMSCQTVSQIADWYSHRYFFDGHVDDFAKRPAEIRHITKDAVVEAARRFIGEKRWVLGGIGSADTALVRTLNQKLETLFE